jgi:Na+/H+ antiporter NhaA
MSEAQTSPLAGTTAWARNLETPLRSFLRTETGSAVLMLAATAVALVWVNADASSYHRVWDTTLTIRIGGSGISESLRYWLNSGLMTFFFFVVGLEARREFDMGELRERRRFALPLAAGIGGTAVPVLIFLAINAGRPSAHGWGAAMSTDTALALGMLALVGPRFPERLRAFMLTVSVVDDVIALIVIATVYTQHVALSPLLASGALLAALLLTTRLSVPHGLLHVALGGGLWFALYRAGVDPVVSGLAVGLLTYASPAARVDLERATDLFKLFREQPTPELARSARIGLTSAISPNERLQQVFHPWTSYAIVPLFALANAGVAINGTVLSRAFTSPITLGILVGYVLGKPVGIAGVSWLVTKVSGGRLRPPVGWAGVAGGGFIAGIGFTVSLLISSLAFHGAELDDAKVGVLSAALVASSATWLLFRSTALLPQLIRIKALVGTADVIVDLAAPIDSTRDHIRGPEDAPVTLLEYGDFECPFCGRAEDVIRELLAGSGEVRYVWRHLPLNDVHPRAQLASEAAEAAAAQGEDAFWKYHDLLLERQDSLKPSDLVGYAGELGLDVDRFSDSLRTHAGAAHIAEDVDGADLSGVSGTPTFFVNGRRHYGAYDIDALTVAVRIAKARATLAASTP